MAKSKGKLLEAVDSDMPSTRGHVNINVDDYPEVKNWKVGKEYDLTVKVKMTGLSDEDYDDTMRASFSIKEIPSLAKNSEKSVEEKEADKINARTKKGRSY